MATQFHPREGDRCIWVDEAEFYDLDDDLDEQSSSITELQAAYRILDEAFHVSSIPFAAIGGFALTLLGGRVDDAITHDVDFQINGSPVTLFSKLRMMPNIRLKKGLQADNFRLHCRISDDKWVGVDIMITAIPILASNFDSFILLQTTPLLQTKLKSFFARTASRDATDIIYLVQHYAVSIHRDQLNQEWVQYFLDNVTGHISIREDIVTMARQVLSTHS